MAEKTPQERFEENASKSGVEGMTPEQLEFAKQAGQARMRRMFDPSPPQPRRPMPGPVPK